MNPAVRRRGALALVFCVVGTISVSGPKVRAAETNLAFGQKPEPISLTLTQLRALVSKAYGPQPGSDERITLDGKVTAAFGFSLGYRATYQGDDYFESVTADSFTEAGGRYKGQRWFQNQNGVVALRKFRHSPSDVDGRLLWRDLFVSDNDVEIVGEIKTPQQAYVVRVTARDEPIVWLAFDIQTGLLNLAQVDFGEGPSNFAFTDYHQQTGIMMASQYTETDASATATITDTVVKLSRTPMRDDSSVRIPVSRRSVEFPTGVDKVTIPMHMDLHQIIVRVFINGRGLDFILDTGTSGILIDRTIAKELGLEEAGPVFRTSKGQPVRSFVSCPRLDIGQLSMHNVLLEQAEFQEQPQATAKYVGLLGYDFIQAVALKIDFEHASLEVVRPERFSPPAGANPIDIRLDDGVPTVTADLSGKVANNIMIDTGSDQPLVFSRFVKEQGWPMPNLKGPGVTYLYYPLATGKVPVALVRLNRVRLGDYYFGGMIAYITYNAPKFEVPETDGIIGTSILLFFDVYFDYPHYKMYLDENSLFKKAAGGK